MTDARTGIPTDAPHTGGVGGRPAVHRRVVLAVVLSATFMQLVDISIVNTAIPSIQKDIDASFGQLQLIISGYTLAFACTLITAARLGDVRGRRTLFLTGMSVFTVASVLCGAAQSGNQLVTFRVIQGLASGLMFPQVLSVIQVVFPPEERGKAFAAYGTTIGIATILGPLLGGILIQLDLAGSSWRSVFFVNVPIGAVALTAAVRYLPQSRSDDAPRLDLPGATLVTVGLFLLVYPLAEGRSRGWPLWLLAMLVLAVPVLAAFGALQVRKTRRDDSPLLRTSLFHERAFSTGSALTLVFFLGLPAFFFTLALYLQVGLGYTALHSGLTSFPFAVGAGVASARSDHLARRLGTRVLSLGTGLLVVSIAGLIALVAARGADLHSWQAWPILLVAGLGLGCFVAPVTTLVLAGVDRNAAGSASGVLSSVTQVGGALGVAVVGTLFFTFVGSSAGGAAGAQAPGLQRELSALGIPQGLSQRAAVVFTDCFTRQVDSRDPRRAPADCQAASGQAAAVSPAAGAAIGAATDRARRATFARAFRLILGWQVLVWSLSFVLVLLLPNVKPPAEPGPRAAE